MSARSDRVADTFALASPRAVKSLVAESVRLVHRSSLERALRWARTDRERLTRAHASGNSSAVARAENEYVRSLERVMSAAEPFAGDSNDTTKETNDHG